MRTKLQSLLAHFLSSTPPLHSVFLTLAFTTLPIHCKMKCSPLVALVSSAALVAAHHHSTTADVRLEIPPLTTFTPKHHGDPTVIIYHTTRELVTHTSTATKRCLPSNKPSPEERDNFPIVETPVAKSSDITILTPENYSQTVHNPTQDIFVEYYAPWCGYCKAYVVPPGLPESLLDSPFLIRRKIRAHLRRPSNQHEEEVLPHWQILNPNTTNRAP